MIGTGGATDRSTDLLDVPASGTGPARPRHPGAARWAALWVLPYLLFGLVWVFTNPPGAAPDENDQLVKTIAAGRLDIGVPYAGSPADTPGSIRNSSIARTVQIPANLAPDGFTCTAFHPQTPAVCLPTQTTDDGSLVERTASVGSYPVFAYVPMGLATRFADSPTSAFHLARVVSLLMSSALLFLAVLHLTRWLGRGAAVGLALGLTPMTIFAAASVSTSGVEIMAAAAVAAVVVVTSRSPMSLAEPATLVLLTISASALALSRQLGVVTLAFLVIVALCRGAAPVVWDQLRRGRWPMIATLVVVGLSVVAVAIWELRYDHPALTGPVVSAGAFGTFIDQSFGHLISGIGQFGWLDTALPGPAIGLWIAVAAVVIGGAILVGKRPDQLTLIGACAGLVVVDYVTHATVFYPIQASVQGRHLLPFFVLIPILSGVAFTEHLQDGAERKLAKRLAIVVGVVMAALQLVAIVVNSRRYAVGTDGPIWFIPDAQWTPRFGWWPWLTVAALAAIWLASMVIRGGRIPVAALSTPEINHVER